jgi:hypothetical protein
MNSQDYKATYEDYSSRASSLVRQCAFAGIAAAWLLKDHAKANGGLSEDLAASIVCFLLAIGLEFFQYTAATIIYRVLMHRCEQNEKESSDQSATDFTHSRIWPAIVATFFLLKIAAVWIGGYYLVRFAIQHLA